MFITESINYFSNFQIKRSVLSMFGVHASVQPYDSRKPFRKETSEENSSDCEIKNQPSSMSIEERLTTSRSDFKSSSLKNPVNKKINDFWESCLMKPIIPQKNRYLIKFSYFTKKQPLIIIKFLLPCLLSTLISSQKICFTFAVYCFLICCMYSVFECVLKK